MAKQLEQPVPMTSTVAANQPDGGPNQPPPPQSRGRQLDNHP